jgi:hypothetical protein
LASLILTSCASSTYKARQEQREKLATSSGLYCEWISGDKHSDIDVEVNLQMGKRCDSSKPFSLTNYKNNADQNGIMYCCAMVEHAVAAPAPRKSSGPAAKVEKPAPPAGAADDIVEDK